MSIYGVCPKTRLFAGFGWIGNITTGVYISSINFIRPTSRRDLYGRKLDKENNMIPLPRHPKFDEPLKSVKGVGPQIEKTLHEKGIRTIPDLLHLMPLHYQDRRSSMLIKDLVENMDAMVKGVVTDARQGRFPRSGKKYFQITIEDESGAINALWFSAPSHMRQTVKKGVEAVLFGKVGRYRKYLQFVHPDIITNPADMPQPEIRPVYPEIEGVKSGALRRVMKSASDILDAVPAMFPVQWLEHHSLNDPIESLKTLHQPPADRPGAIPKPNGTRAWRSLALFELLFLQITLARSRARLANLRGHSFPNNPDLTVNYLRELPFSITSAQKKALREIVNDMSEAKPMNRLLQGDVGCGKTVVAIGAALAAVSGGRQAAIMAPTELLARQHFESLEPYAERLGVKVDLLSGSLGENEKKMRRASVASGETDIVVGTQALISSGLEFKNLGLAIIDEQHRFGVAQRLALRKKADNPDILVMTATPIPRSLAMTLYGDLDATVIDESPPGRTPATATVFSQEQRSRAYQILKKEIEAGGLAYVVAPRIEAVDDAEAEIGLVSAEQLFDYLSSEVLPDFPVGLVHGRMKTEEQQAVMDKFRKGDVKVLVATTVVEVGVDVPEATVMLVEGANRFGLAQLHQLRGRVGRGVKPGVCLLVDGTDGEGTSSRLAVMEKTADGFELAEEDLKIRGPGDATGMKQSGLPAFHWAKLPADIDLLIRAKDLAEELVRDDPELRKPGLALVRDAADRMEQLVQTELADVG